ncbi:MAG: ECF transporter S component, partial [Clostridia bacterium]|nr:ECF transporter S component [Clostridia bacterium]
MKKAEKTAVYGVFAAIIVVLQLLSYTLKIGTFNLSLVLIPIVFGAYLYGPKAGAFFGFVFGAVVVAACAMGIDAGGAILFGGSPIITALVCLIKGTAAGWVAGFICSSFAKNGKNKYLGVILAAAAAPIVNTGLFTAA